MSYLSTEPCLCGCGAIRLQSRGLCSKIYAKYYRMVRSGIKSWKEYESEGKALPAVKQGKAWRSTMHLFRGFAD